MGAGQDLTALTLLAIERERITNQNAAIPARLICAWIRLGETAHALELVQSMPASYDRILGQVEFAAALADSDPESAVRVAEQAEGVAHSLGSPELQRRALSQIAVAFARAGLWPRAEQTASALGDLGDRTAALAAVAEAAAERDPARATHFAEQAEQLADALKSPPARMLAMAEVAAALAGSRAERAVQLAKQAEQLARTVPGYETRTRALAQVAIAFARAGQWEQAEGVAHSLGSPELQRRALSQIAVAFARAGLWPRAEQTASALGDLGDRTAALAAVAEAAAERDPARATHFAEQAEKVARTIPRYESRTSALAKVAMAFARAGQWDRVVAAARSRGGGRLQAWEMADLAAMLASHNPDHAVRLADEAEGLLGSTLDPAAVMCEIGVALARAGRLDRAEGIARSLRNPRKRARVAAELAIAAARSRQWDRAEQIAGTLSDPQQQARVRAEIAAALVEAGQWSQAANVAQTITDPFERAQAFIRVAAKMATSPDQRGAPPDPRDSRSRGLIASVLASEHWSLAVPLLGDLEAEQLSTVLAAVSVQGNGLGRIVA